MFTDEILPQALHLVHWEVPASAGSIIFSPLLLFFEGFCFLGVFIGAILMLCFKAYKLHKASEQQQQQEPNPPLEGAISYYSWKAICPIVLVSIFINIIVLVYAKFYPTDIEPFLLHYADKVFNNENITKSEGRTFTSTKSTFAATFPNASSLVNLTCLDSANVICQNADALVPIIDAIFTGVSYEISSAPNSIDNLYTIAKKFGLIAITGFLYPFLECLLMIINKIAYTYLSGSPRWQVACRIFCHFVAVVTVSSTMFLLDFIGAIVTATKDSYPGELVYMAIVPGLLLGNCVVAVQEFIYTWSFLLFICVKVTIAKGEPAMIGSTWVLAILFLIFSFIITWVYHQKRRIEYRTIMYVVDLRIAGFDPLTVRVPQYSGTSLYLYTIVFRLIFAYINSTAVKWTVAVLVLFVGTPLAFLGFSASGRAIIGRMRNNLKKDFVRLEFLGQTFRLFFGGVASKESIVAVRSGSDKDPKFGLLADPVEDPGTAPSGDTSPNVQQRTDGVSQSSTTHPNPDTSLTDGQRSDGGSEPSTPPPKSATSPTDQQQLDEGSEASHQHSTASSEHRNTSSNQRNSDNHHSSQPSTSPNPPPNSHTKSPPKSPECAYINLRSDLPGEIIYVSGPISQMETHFVFRNQNFSVRCLVFPRGSVGVSGILSEQFRQKKLPGELCYFPVYGQKDGAGDEGQVMTEDGLPVGIPVTKAVPVYNPETKTFTFLGQAICYSVSNKKLSVGADDNCFHADQRTILKISQEGGSSRVLDVADFRDSCEISDSSSLLPDPVRHGMQTVFSASESTTDEAAESIGAGVAQTPNPKFIAFLIGLFNIDVPSLLMTIDDGVVNEFQPSLKVGQMRVVSPQPRVTSPDELNAMNEQDEVESIVASNLFNLGEGASLPKP